MRLAAFMFLALSVVCEIFGYWGSSTVEGRATYDEMAGIVPAVAQVLGGLLALGAFICWWSARTKP